MPDDTFTRSAIAVRWNVLANIIFVALGIVQTVWLARLLPVELFGVYALAHSIIWLTSMITNMGMGGAFLHRTDETADEDRAVAVLFSLKCVYTLIWVLLLLSATWLFSDDATFRLAMTVLTLANGVTHLTQAGNMLLIRRIEHRRLSLMTITNSVLTLIVSVGLALAGAGIWALVSSAVMTATVKVLGFYIIAPVWRPYFAWDAAIRRYYWRFGSRKMIAQVLLYALDKIDDIWTGWLLGSNALGFYSQAYTFATYPRRVLSESIKTVVTGTYADLKQQPQKLAIAFTVSNGLIIRLGFLLAGGLALVAPEFIRLVLGDKWLPMLDAFRLMLLFTMLDPIRETVADFFVAVGEPQVLIQTRLWQLAVLVIGLVMLSPRFGIEGVALAVVAMLCVGIGQMLYLTKQRIDFSLREIFLVPSVALLIACLVALAAMRFVAPAADWAAFLLKGSVFTGGYGIIWLGWERHQLRRYMQLITRRHLSTNTNAD